MPVIETGPDEWRSSARPSSYTRKSIFRKKLALGLDPRVGGFPQKMREKVVGSGRNRTSCQKGLRLQRSDGTSLSLFALPELAET
jgi:hypothetical protein